jgi:hypothetical protein
MDAKGFVVPLGGGLVLSMAPARPAVLKSAGQRDLPRQEHRRGARHARRRAGRSCRGAGFFLKLGPAPARSAQPLDRARVRLLIRRRLGDHRAAMAWRWIQGCDERQ